MISSANIKKLIRTARRKFSGESQIEYQFRQQRSKLLSTTLEGVKLKEIFKSEIRNTLEHFDEYLDRANISLGKKGMPPSPWAAYNMVLSDWNVFSPPVYPVRVYIAKDRTFHNLQHSISVGAIYEEAQAILNRLREMRVFPQGEEPGALVTKLREI